jgi:uncharacterized membrane protein YesL
LFGRFFDYSKPGKGVDPDEPQKRPFFLYFELIWRKFSRFFLLNLCYAILILPLVLSVYFMVLNLAIDRVDTEYVQSLFASMLILFAYSFFVELPVLVWGPLLVLSAVLFGPATCGLTYITRNWARQEHADLSDLKDRALSNFKQGLFLGILDIAVYVLLLRNIVMSVNAAAINEFTGTVLTVAQALSVVGLVIYTFMRYYTYQMAITFELKLLHVLKNAWLFAVMGMFRNLLATVVVAGTMILFLFIHPIAELIFFFLFAFSYWSFSNNFITYPLVKKHMLKDEQPDENITDQGPPPELPE